MARRSRKWLGFTPPFRPGWISFFLFVLPKEGACLKTKPARQESTATITDEDLKAFFESLYRHKGMTPDPERIGEIVVLVKRAVPTDHKRPNEAINELVTQAAMKLK